MWDISRECAPYLSLTMSECSALVGWSEDRVIVAHMSYSSIRDLDAALELMGKHSIASERIVAIANVGSIDLNTVEPIELRTMHVDDYSARGLSKELIVPFTLGSFYGEPDGSSVLEGLVGLTASADGAYAWQFDLKRKRGADILSSVEEQTHVRDMALIPAPHR